MTSLKDKRSARFTEIPKWCGNGHLLDVFLLVVIRHLHVSSARLEIDSLLLAKDLVLDGKVLKDDIINVVFTVNKMSATSINFAKGQAYALTAST